MRNPIQHNRSSSYLPAVHELYCFFSEEEIDVVLVLYRPHKVRSVEMFEIVLLSPQLVSDNEGIGATEVRHSPAVELPVCRRKQNHSNCQVKENCFIYTLPPALPGLAKCCINNVIMLESSQEEMYALKYNNGIRNINSPVNIKVELCLGS